MRDRFVLVMTAFMTACGTRTELDGASLDAAPSATFDGGVETGIARVVTTLASLDLRPNAIAVDGSNMYLTRPRCTGQCAPTAR